MTNILTNSSASIPIALGDYRDLLSVKDLMEIFGVSKQTVRKEIKQGKFGTPIQIGRAYKIPKIYVVQRYFQAQEPDMQDDLSMVQS